MTYLILFFAIYSLIIAGIVWLQVFLSKKENKWLGLILPIICVLISLSAALGLALYVPAGSTESNVSMIFPALYIFVLFNIPTAILIAIYAGFRKKRNKNSEMEIMKIKDLD